MISYAYSYFDLIRSSLPGNLQWNNSTSTRYIFRNKDARINVSFNVLQLVVKDLFAFLQ